MKKVCKTLKLGQAYDVVDKAEEYIEDTMFYLNCNGMIINGADWSYDTQDNNPDVQICKVDEFAKTLKDNIPECELRYI